MFQNNTEFACFVNDLVVSGCVTHFFRVYLRGFGSGFFGFEFGWFRSWLHLVGCNSFQSKPTSHNVRSCRAHFFDCSVFTQSISSSHHHHHYHHHSRNQPSLQIVTQFEEDKTPKYYTSIYLLVLLCEVAKNTFNLN